MKQCPNCSSVVQDNAPFCPTCGVRFAPGSAPPPSYRAPAPSYAAAGSAVRAHSGISIAGFLLSVVTFTLSIIGYIILLTGINTLQALSSSPYSAMYLDEYGMYKSLVTGGYLLLIGALFYMPGMVCCIVGCTQEKQKKRLAVIGLGLLVIILVMILVSLIVSWAKVNELLYKSFYRPYQYSYSSYPYY